MLNIGKMMPEGRRYLQDFSKGEHTYVHLLSTALSMGVVKRRLLLP
jgi:hypothetical protein